MGTEQTAGPAADRPGPQEASDAATRARQVITDDLTRLIAAVTLAHEDFPLERDLPRVAPVPYNHLGHQVLLDYHKLTAILWGTVHEIQEAIRNSPLYTLAPILGFVVALAVAGLGVAVFAAHTAEPAAYLIVLGAAVVIGLGTYRALRISPEKIAADVRARNLRLLLAGKVPPCAAELETTVAKGKKLALWGDGNLERDGCPVLVMLSDDHPFPGFGRHQGRQLFVCRPDDEKGPPGLSNEALHEAISEALVAMIRSSGIPCVSSGQVVLIDGHTLRKDSRWLGLAPPLFLPPDRAARPGRPERPAELLSEVERSNVSPATAREFDKRASVRAYTAIQALVPEYLMCVTFFVRTFQAGNSAACEVNVSTLGPPARDWDYIRDRLRVHDREQGPGRDSSLDPGAVGAHVSSLGSRLHIARWLLENPSAVFTSQARRTDILELGPFDEEALDHEAKQAERIAATGSVWPGIFTALDNWREQHSITFTTDFFGNTESQAVLKTLHDRICRSALSRLKELGFDISDYQDESGKFSINADSIEHLVVGERVYLEKKKAPAGQDAPGNEAGAKA
jgi:hypothetical protein